MPKAEFTVEQWEAQRATFTRLYVDEDRSLKEIVSIMAMEYSFTATERQYKRKISAWNLDKNIKEKDMRVIVHKMLKRKFEDDKDSEFLVHGRKVHAHKILRYHNDKAPEYMPLSNRIVTPSHIQYRTPVPTPHLEECTEQSTSIAHYSASDVSPATITSTDTSNTRQCFAGMPPRSRQSQIDLRILDFELGQSDSTIEVVGNAMAKVCCFLWHGPSVRPTSAFHKWVVTVLATTRVTVNVCILAMAYLYKLRCRNPGVKTKAGSHYRVLGVGLILANMFLDDNNYTLRTWAEVTGLSLSELPIMQVEFLSNFTYDLFFGPKQWQEWKLTFARFKNAPEETLPTLWSEIVAGKQGKHSSLSLTTPKVHTGYEAQELSQGLSPVGVRLSGEKSNLSPIPTLEERSSQLEVNNAPVASIIAPSQLRYHTVGSPQDISSPGYLPSSPLSPGAEFLQEWMALVNGSL